MYKKYLSLVAAIFLALSGGLVPFAVFADQPTGKEPWSDAFIEAHGTHYELKNLTNTAWQSGVHIWWRAKVPCGSFIGAGLSATWNRGTADCSALPEVPHGMIAIFIENPALSGKVREYTDGNVVQVPDGFEHLIVYTEYPEEGYEHGFSTGLLFADKAVVEKYASAKGTGSTEPFPATAGASSESSNTPKGQPATQNGKSGGVPWVPIAFGVAVLAGAGYWVRSRLIGGDYGKNKVQVADEPSVDTGTRERNQPYDSVGIWGRILKFIGAHGFGGMGGGDQEEEEDIQMSHNRRIEDMWRQGHDQTKKDKEESQNRCLVESEALEKARAELRKAEKEHERMRAYARNRSIVPYSKETGDTDRSLGTVSQAKLTEARRAAKKADEEFIKAQRAYEKCMKETEQWVGYKGKLGEKAQADYEKPEDVPDEPEAM